MGVHPSILVVDDDAAGRAMLGLALRQAGLAAETAAGGEEALSLLREKRYDWLITDARMSPMDGFRLARRAKRLWPRLHILMVSALCTDRDAEDTPIEKFFPKPIAVDQIVRWIRA